MAAADISVYGRATQGVRLMRIGDDARVISIARTEKEDDDETEATETALETADEAVNNAGNDTADEAPESLTAEPAKTEDQ